MTLATTPGDSSAKRHGRPPSRQAALLQDMRRLIVEGHFRPGARMPIRAELQRNFAASCITVQRVVDRLARDGLVEARGPLGTFVVDRPPHLHRIALVFPNASGPANRWNSYYAALSRAAEDLRRDGLLIDQFCAEPARQSTPDFDQLQNLCRDGLLAGLIFASPPEQWTGTPVSDAPLPRVSLSACQHPDAIVSHPDQDSFITHAVAHLAQIGSRRPAVIAGTQVTEHPNRWTQCFAEAGIPLRPQWLLGADLEHPSSATRLARLLAAPWSGERPDALVIADDNFEDPVLAGLMAEGVRVGSEMQILAHANFPLQSRLAAPVVRLGFAVTSLLRHAVDEIMAMRSGRPCAPSLLLQATFADGS